MAEWRRMFRSPYFWQGFGEASFFGVIMILGGLALGWVIWGRPHP